MSNERDSAYEGLKIGRTLELARKQRGLSLREAEQETKIRARYLRELERENFEVLPPVYVQGSLKTYANFLGLDGDGLARELRRRQPLEDEPEAPTRVEPPKTDYVDRYLIARGAAGVGGAEVAEDEESGGAAPVPAGDNHRLYLISGAFLVLILTSVALVLTLAKGSQPEVSQVREPLVSQAPSRVSHAGEDEGSRASLQQGAGGSENPQPDQHAASPNKDAKDDATGGPAQDPHDATAVASAPPATTAATAQPAATPAPSKDEPAPEATRPAPSRAPAGDNGGVVGAAGVQGPVAHAGVQGPVAQNNDNGPVNNFSITKNTSIGGASPTGTRTSAPCSRRGGGPKVLQDKEGFRACLIARVRGGGDRSGG